MIDGTELINDRQGLVFDVLPLYPLRRNVSREDSRTVCITRTSSLRQRLSSALQILEASLSFP